MADIFEDSSGTTGGQATPRRSPLASLSARITLLLTLAMLPLGLISVYQTRVVVNDARTLSEAALKARTVAAASQERELVERSMGAAQGLAAYIAELDQAECSQMLGNFVAADEVIIFAGYVEVSGQMNCSSTGATYDFTGSERLREAIERNGPVIQVNRSGVVTGQSVVLASQPVRRNGVLLGFITLSIPHTVANARMDSTSESDGLRLASVNQDGELIAATSSLDTAISYMPADVNLAELATRPNSTFTARSANGESRVFAVVRMFDDGNVLVGSWPEADLSSYTTSLQGFMATVFPMLMWIVSVGVALFGVRRLVTRHVADLRSAMRRFALGDRVAMPLRLVDAPLEFQDAERAFNRMALLITEAEGRREQDVRDKEVLLREIHHRVKNNLQLIASIMNLQARKTRSAEAKSIISGLQQRVRAMAVLHRSLYSTPTMTTVDAADLVKAVIGDVLSVYQSSDTPSLTTSLQSVQLVPDQAVPLSLLVAEALTNALKYGAPGDAGATPIHIGLNCRDDGQIELSVSNDAHIGDARAKEPGDGIGQQLITAFLGQLDGTQHVVHDAGRYTLSVVFPRADHG